MEAQDYRRLIVFVGHDNSGKSSIIRELVKYVDFQSLKLDLDLNKSSRSVSKDDLRLQRAVSYDVQLQFLEKLDNLNLIFDRGHPCEYAYAKTFDRLFDEEQVFYFDSRCKKLNCLIVYCYKDKEFYQDDDEDKITGDKYDSLKKYYEEFLEKTSCNVLKLNTSDQNVKNQIDQIIKEIY